MAQTLLSWLRFAIGIHWKAIWEALGSRSNAMIINSKGSKRTSK